jgi:hypothetical protein
MSNKKKCVSTKLVHESNESSNQIVTPADGTVEAILNTVTKEDVIAILVQERSDDLTAKKVAGEAELHRLDAAIQAVTARWPKVTASHKRLVSTVLDERAAKAIADAGYIQLVVEVDEGQRNDEKGSFTFRVTLKASNKYTGSYYDTLNRNVVVPYDTRACEILTETTRLKREIATAQQHLLSIKREIADIPIMERRARAKLAQVSISRDKDGAALLAELRKVKELSTTL